MPDYDFLLGEILRPHAQLRRVTSTAAALCYVLDISGYLQGLWNRYLAAKAEAGGGTVDLAKVADRSIYLGPGPTTLHQRFRQGAGHAGRGYAAPVALDLTYTLMK